MGKKKPAKTARKPLTRERVLRAACAMADREGIENLSMRRLAQSLSVGTMSLYNHIADKNELLAGILDVVLEEIELPEHQADWRAAKRRSAISTRAAFLRHPWAVELMGREGATPVKLRFHDANLGHFRRAGFSVAMAVRANAMLEGYIYGVALQSNARPSMAPDDYARQAETMLAHLPAEAYPFIVETLSTLISASGFSYDDEFEFGLDIILNALEPDEPMGHGDGPTILTERI